MYLKSLLGAVAAAGLIAIPAEPVQADTRDFIAGAIVGGLVGANAKKKRSSSSSSRNSAARQEARNIQASLNYFGFDAGVVDGSLGRKTRQAVSQYQAYLGYPVTGQLSEFEKSLLTSSYNRAQAGGYAVQQATISAEGTKSLLKTYRAEMAGQTAPAPAPVQPVAAATAPATGALPNFLGSGNTQTSLAAHCNTVSLITNTNGGFTTAATMTDPVVALNEQFCLARTYAIAKSEEMTAQLNGFSPDQIAQQCAAFGPPMKPHVVALSTKQRDAVVLDVSSFAQTTGMSAQQLAGTARICMGVGYRIDNMDVAVGSALLLYTLGEPVYGELMGHHLALGFGPEKNTDMAGAWYDAGLSAVDAGATAVFAPGQPERVQLIRAASQRLSGGLVPLVPLAPQPAAAGNGLPVFSISE